MSITRRLWSVRALQTAAVAAAYGAWLLSQQLLETSRGVVTGFTDHSHELLAGANAYLHAHPGLADVILAVSSFEVDLAAICMVAFFFTRRESRPLLGLWLILIMRQLCQASISIPPPDGMIWHYPGVPTIVVTYSTSTDFFFSGHMALATLLAAELTAQRAPRLKQFMAWGIAFAQALVILSMRFHYFTDVVAGCLAAVAAIQLAQACGRRLDARLAPWSTTADRVVATSGAVPLRARWQVGRAAARAASPHLEPADGGRL
ncbi:MAG TPA: phosphatase PAP2-related protein [Vicinamibacterales bacterium]|nr:phosphatase PAP2-related protein [Vicinamibacterales bacterium]